MNKDNFKIRATIDCSPLAPFEPRMYKIIKGASASLTFNLSKKCYLSEISIEDQLNQVQFILKYGKFSRVYIYNGNEDSQESVPEEDYAFELITDAEGNCALVLYLGSNETKCFPETTYDDGLRFEVVIKADGKAGIERTIIEEQMPIIVTDSLYNQVEGE